MVPPQIVMDSITATNVRVQLLQEAGSVPAIQYRVTAERLTSVLQPRCSEKSLRRVGLIKNSTTIYLSGLMEYSIYKLTVSAMYRVQGDPVNLENYTFFSTKSAGIAKHGTSALADDAMP